MRAKHMLIAIFFIIVSIIASVFSLLTMWNLPGFQAMRWAAFVLSTISFGILTNFSYTFFKRKMHLHIHNRLKGCWIAFTSTHVIVLGAEPLNAKKQVLSKFNSHNLTPVDINWLMEKGLIHFNATVGSNQAMEILKGGANNNGSTNADLTQQ